MRSVIMSAFWSYFLDFFGLSNRAATLRAILTADPTPLTPNPPAPPPYRHTPMPTSSLLPLLDSGDPAIYALQSKAPGPAGSLPLTDEMLREWPSGDLFGLSQDAGMGWNPAELG